MSLLVSTNSKNRKLGLGVVSTYRPVGPTCPKCPLLNNGCYANRGPMHFAQKKSGAKDDSMDEMNGAPLVRHHVSGDFFKESKDGRKLVDKKYVELFKKWHRRGVQKWTNAWVYTHGAEQLERAGHGAESWPENVQVLASCDSKEDAKALQGKGWRTARVTEELDDLEPGEVHCPYDKHKVTGKGKAITCHVCRLCIHDGPNIVFLKH